MNRQKNLYRVDFRPAPSLGINAKLGCMTIVAARFKPEPADCSAEYLPKELSRDTKELPQSEWKTSRTDDSIENHLRPPNLSLIPTAKPLYDAHSDFSQS